MGILTTILSACLLYAPFPQDGQAFRRSPEEIALYIKELESALAPGADPLLRRHKIRSARQYVDAQVIVLLDTKALRHEDAEARFQAVNALGYMRHPDALAVLVKTLARDDQALRADPPSYANVIRAIARKGDKAMIPLFVKDLFASPELGVIRARVLGLANIRTRESVDELILMMRSAAPERVMEVMLEMRTALFLLTGVDKGLSPELWLSWYDDAKDSLTVASRMPETMEPEVRRTWNNFWGADVAKRRNPPDGPHKGPSKRGEKRNGKQGDDE
jgi:hypothetical protein